ncbi:MAG: glycosyltransferase family 2 protein [Nitrososphaerota archaeon]|jgi:glycosyltransferase involved in cell wall biosynthesis|nr:glycosyltransferase family 2 protein [Nitrososphaerota archaeon]MDG6917406.1 glycosyltransferase family 2 protein [Nitrososphaerota archaeon]MDG6919460.1 glycosyltransferase family 2 protein [Nitrososphaerota archaeon]
MDSDKAASICITTYNGARTLKPSLQSILSQIGPDFEVVVVDNCSTDGSENYLAKLQAEGSIRLIEKKCSRGLGRQIAFEHSTGRYVFASVDTDTIYRPVFKDVLEIYKRKYEGSVLVLKGLQISSREITKKIGWRDLQWGEDRDMWARTARDGCLLFFDYDVKTSARKMGGGRIAASHKLRYHYEIVRDAARTGFSFPVIAAETRSWPSIIVFACLLVPCTLIARTYPNWRNPWNKRFRLQNYQGRGVLFENQPPTL